MNIEIREVDIKDAPLLFEWANDPDTRKNSFHPGPVEWNEHVVWLSNKLSDPSCKMFIFHQNNIPVGVVRFVTEKHSIIGANVAPDKRGKGLGAKIIKMACTQFWEQRDRPIFAYIKKANKSSLKVCENAGFKLFRSDFYNQIPCFILIAEKIGN